MKYAEAWNKLLTFAVKEISRSDTSLKKRFGERSKHFHELCEPVDLGCPLSISGCGPRKREVSLDKLDYLQFISVSSVSPTTCKEWIYVFSTTLEDCNIPDTLSFRYQHLYSMESAQRHFRRP